MKKGHEFIAFESQITRLRRPLSWFPYPALLSFLIALILSSHISLGLNPRLGSLAEPISMNSSPSIGSSIWLSIDLRGDDIVVMTSERQVFQWPQSSQDLNDSLTLQDYLLEKIILLSTSATLSLNHSKELVNVTLAVDQKLKYAHLKLVLYALAAAGISEYNFETRQLGTET